ncbi:MAG: adenylate/guanylate cyclase domain-containing protein [Rhizobiaceae bacterium]
MSTRTGSFNIRRVLAVPDRLESEEAREYAFFKVAYPVAVLSHISWAFIFWFNDLQEMFYYNLAVSALFLIGGFIWARSRLAILLIVVLWLIEIPFHALLGTYYGGFTTLFWTAPLVSAITCLITPKFSWKLRSMLAFLAVLAAGGLGLATFYMPPVHPLTASSNIYLFTSNFVGILGSLTLFLGINQFIAKEAEEGLAAEFDRAENLLRNILPDQIALRLKNGERVIADEHIQVSVVFADIVNFTEASANLAPSDLVQTLNLVFSEFDKLAEKHGAEKIKTIGDAYMVVVGVPDAQNNHADAAADLAIDMLKTAEALRQRTHFDVQLRIGINSGPVVAGVIGERKFAYDLWGDAVNVASRMESHGEPGQILTSETTANLLSDRFAAAWEGMRDIKGKGPTAVYSVKRAEKLSVGIDS